MTRKELIDQILEAENHLRDALALLPKNARTLKMDIQDWLTELDDSDLDNDEDCEQEEEFKPVIEIATSNPYVEKALSVLEGFLGNMGNNSPPAPWPTEVRMRAAELILNYHKE